MNGIVVRCMNVNDNIMGVLMNLAFYIEERV